MKNLPKDIFANSENNDKEVKKTKTKNKKKKSLKVDDGVSLPGLNKDQIAEFVEFGLFIDDNDHSLNAYNLVEEEPFRVSDKLCVVEVSNNLNTQSCDITLEHTFSSGRCQYIKTSLAIIQQKNKLLATFSNFGVCIEYGCEAFVSDYLRKKVRAYGANNEKFTHTRLGWGDCGDTKKGYFASKSIGAKYPSTLLGDDDGFIGPHGDKSVYDKMIEEQVLPVKTMHLPLALGFAAPIVPLLEGKSGVKVLMTNFVATSGSGKSTSMKLIASLWGQGEVSNRRFCVAKTFACTQNAFAGALKDIFGFPVIFDDYSQRSSNVSLGNLIYNMSAGSEKLRYNTKDRDIFTWSTWLGMTGEDPIFSVIKDKKNGQIGRIVEFIETPFTKDENNSNAILDVVKKHYGFYGEEFVERIMQTPLEKVEEVFNKSKDLLKQHFHTSNGVHSRLWNSYALIRTAAVLARDLMGLKLDVDFITQTLISNEHMRQLMPTPKELIYDDIVAYINTHLSSFVQIDRYLKVRSRPSGNCYGKVFIQDDNHYVAVVPQEIEKILQRYQDRRSILKGWRDEGFLVPDENEKDKRFTKRLTISEMSVPGRYYLFKFKGNEEFFQELLKTDDPEILIDLEEVNIEPPMTNLKSNESNKDEVVREKNSKTNTLHREYIVSKPKPKKDSLTETPTVDTDYSDDEAINAIFNDDSEEGK